MKPSRVGPSQETGTQGSPPEGRKNNLPAVIALVLALAVLGVLAFLIFSPFLSTIILAIVLSAVGQPVNGWVLRRIGEKRRGLAAGITLAALVLLVVLPLGALGWKLATQAVEGARSISGHLVHASENLETKAWFQDLLQEEWVKSAWESVAASRKILRSSPGLLGPVPGGSAPKEASPPAAADASADADAGLVAGPPLPAGATSFIKASFGFASWISGTLADIVRNTLDACIKFCMMLFVLFFFLKDGAQILQSFERMIPMDAASQDKLVTTFRDTTRSIIKGTLVTALAQGAAAGIAFLIVGIPAVFWGALAAFSSLIPPIGTALIMVPMTVFLLLEEQWTKGIFLAVASLGISSLDTLLRPLLVGQTLHMHPIWLLLSILGALQTFGPMGLIYGPLVMVLLGTCLRLAEQPQPGKIDPPKPASAK